MSRSEMEPSVRRSKNAFLTKHQISRDGTERPAKPGVFVPVLGGYAVGFWLTYQRGSFFLKEFHQSRGAADDRAGTLASQVGYVKLLDESHMSHADIHTYIAGAIQLDTVSNRLIL